MSAPAQSDQFDFFVSYARKDNESDWITHFIEQLQKEQRAYSGGRKFRVFFDKDDIHSLDDWQHRIYESLAASRLLVAFISPNYFASEWCRREWHTWIDVEIAKHVLSDGAAPIYIVEVPWLGQTMTEQQVAEAIAQLTQKTISDLKPGLAADALKVTGEMLLRQLTQGARTDPKRTTPMPFFASVQDFQTAGVEALRREDLRRVLATLSKDLNDRAQHVADAARSRSTIPPYNRRFVGRLDELALLRERLHQGRTGVISGHKGNMPEDKTTIASVHGLGGIGKTELAFTYAHAFAGLYPGGRFLVPCDGRSDIRLAMLALDEIFRDQISDEERKTLDLHFGAIRDCLRRRVGELGRILLVLDNVTDAALLSPEQTDHLRLLGSDLHLLATTRLGAPEGGGTYDDVHWLTLGELSFEDSLRLLEKHRSFATPAEHTAAERIARLLGGFALCVEVVGAYLAQHPDQSYASYLDTDGLSDLEHVDQTAERRDVSTRRHNNEKRLSAILAPTLASLSAEAVTALEFSALLPPDHIVLPWLRQLVGGKHPTVADGADLWQRLVARLVSLALLTRGQDGNQQAQDESHQPRILRCHRLLQDFMGGRLTADGKATLQQAVDALVRERAAVLEQTTRWTEARWELEPLTALGGVWDETNHAWAAWLLGQAATCWYQLGEWPQAEPLMRRALAIDEQSFGPEHPDVALRLNNLALLLQATNRLAEAEPLLRRGLVIKEQSFGPDHPSVAIGLDNLAQMLKATNQLVEAEPLLRRALAIDEQSFGPENPDVAIGLNNLANLLQATNRLAEAEPLMRRVVDILEDPRGEPYPNYAGALNNLAQLLQATNRLAEAEPLLRRALAIDEQSFGPEHPKVANQLNNLAQLLQATNRLAEAEPLMRRALAIHEQSFGPEHPNVAINLNNLATLLQDTNRLAEAEPLMRRHLEIFLQFTRATGHPHPHLQAALGNYASLLEAMGRSQPEVQAQLNAVCRPYGIQLGGQS